MTFTIRPRTPDDLDACAALVARLRVNDGYPIFLRGGDTRAFVESGEPIAAWVAVDPEGAVVGHVGLHASTIPPALDLAVVELGVPRDRLGVIARLMVAPEARRSGVAATLLATATAEARERGLAPMLDVARRFSGSIEFYDRMGWRRIGETEFTMPEGGVLESYVYLAPEVKPGSP